SLLCLHPTKKCTFRFEKVYISFCGLYIKNFFYDINDINMKMKMQKGTKTINALGKFDIRINIVKE
ncbi:hypothetical protein, partial [Ornithobacterium rhinotracheale]|uniref:hypothetical protein n=1 Tax=Ornithobacterium rhinotracheale TaxID=28251 RepID=UPI004036CAB0